MADSIALNPGLMKVHRIFYIAYFAFAAIFAILGIMTLLGPGRQDAALGFVGIGVLPIGVLHWYAAKGAALGTPAGRVISTVIACLFLIGFPVGTALSIYMFIKLTQWKGAQPIHGEVLSRGA